MAFPTTFSNYATGSSSTTLLAAGHAANHNALEAKIGIDSSVVATSLDYLLKNTSSVDPGHKHTEGSLVEPLTLTAPVISTISNSGTITLPTSTDTLVGKTTTDVLTNKTIVQKVTSYTPAAAGTSILDLTTGNIHKITMPEGNITIAISNEAVGQCFLVEITQDAVGSRTVTWFTTIRWADGSAPTLTTTASKRDTFGFRVTGTDTYDGYVVGQNL